MSDSGQQPDEAMPAEAGLTPRQALLKEIGRRLTEARQARGEPLSRAVRSLKLRQIHLEALESGDWASLPDDVYALGFLRQYSAYLSLDLSEDIQRIKNDQYSLTRPLTFPDPPVAPSRRWSWIAAVAFIILFIAFNIIDLEQLSSPSPSPEKQEEQAVMPATPAEPAAPEPAAPIEETPAAPADESPATNEAAETDETPSAESEPTAPPAPEALPVAQQATPETATAAPADEQTPTVHQFRFEAVGDAVWLQVFLPDASGQAKGELRKEVLLQAGSSFTISEPVESLWITCGNPFALQISADGQVKAEAGTLGPAGKVLRDHQFRIQPQ